MESIYASSSMEILERRGSEAKKKEKKRKGYRLFLCLEEVE